MRKNPLSLEDRPGLGPVVLLALVVLYHWPVLFGGRVYPAVDASRFFFPVWAWAVRAWNAGMIPLWNPDMGCGAPFACDPQTASFYPPLRIAYFLQPPVTAFHGLIAAHHFWALLGAWAYMRRKGWNLWACLAGALAFGFSATMVSSLWTPVALIAASWIPWVFLTGEAVKAGKRGAAPAAFACLALQGLSGYPVIPYLTGLLLWVYLAWVEDAPGPSYGWQTRLLLSQFLAAFVNLVWALPFLEVLRLGSLSSDGQAHSQALGWYSLRTFLDPFALGHPLDKTYSGPPYWVSSFYIGLPALVLAAWGAVKALVPRGGVSRRGLAFSAFVVCLALGETAGLGGWLKTLVPGYRLVVRSGFLLPIMAFVLSIFAAGVLQRLMVSGRPSGWKSPARILGASVLVLSLATLAPPAWSLRWTLPETYYTLRPSWVAQLNSTTPRLLHSPALLAASSRLEGATREEAYDLAKSRVTPNWPLLWGFGEVVDYNSFGLQAIRDWKRAVFQESPKVSRQALNFLGVDYLIGKTDLPGLQADADLGGGAVVSRNFVAHPLWFPVTRGLSSNGMEADLARLDREGLGLDQTAFVDRPDAVGDFASRRVDLYNHEANRLYFDAPSEGRGLVVSSETAAPGWVVRVNRQRREPLVVDHAFRGVVLGPGEREVRWSYEPTSFRLGLFLCLLSLTCGCLWSLTEWRNG